MVLDNAPCIFNERCRLRVATPYFVNLRDCACLAENMGPMPSWNDSMGKVIRWLITSDLTYICYTSLLGKKAIWMMGFLLIYTEHRSYESVVTKWCIVSVPFVLKTDLRESDQLTWHISSNIFEIHLIQNSTSKIKNESNGVGGSFKLRGCSASILNDIM